MAAILTYIELEGNHATPASLSVLNLGRMIASDLGATTYALLPCAQNPTYGNDDIIAVLSRHGADKVILITHPDLGLPAFYTTQGEALNMACHQYNPRLILFPSSEASHDIAPRIAATIGAHFFSNAWIEFDESGPTMCTCIFQRSIIFKEPLIDFDGPLVLTVTPQEEAQPIGDEEAEVVVQSLPEDFKSFIQINPLAENEIPKSTTTSQIVVGGGAGLRDKAAFDLIAELAKELGGVPAASPTACDRGFAPPEWRVGIDGHAVESQYYLAFGISGSPKHIAACAPRTKIIAINSDPQAPIMKVASYKIIADAQKTLTDLLNLLKEQNAAQNLQDAGTKTASSGFSKNESAEKGAGDNQHTAPHSAIDADENTGDNQHTAPHSAIDAKIDNSDNLLPSSGTTMATTRDVEEK